MKHFFISIMAIICLLMASSSADAQLIIRNNGHAEIGVNPFEPLPDSLSQYSLILDTVTVFKLFGDGPMGAGARMSFGDNLMYHNFNVMVGEVEYEIEASGVVRLEDGFQVERGATFAVYPSSF